MKMSDGDTCPHCGKNSKYANQPLHLPAGFVVSGKHPYVLGAALGQGGFGITYIALDMVTNTRVAIKEYFPTHCSGRTANHSVTAYQNQADVYRKGKERFLNEARTLQSLTELPSIVNVLDFFEANNSAYLVMEFLDGISLKEYAARNGTIPAQAFLEQLKPLMEDIHRMHERGVIHRDIAPDNIMLLPDGRMKLIDFGAARSFVGDKSMTVVVKKGFAPVEQYLSRGSTASTDVYALAATIYYCITGKVPPDSADRQYDSATLTSPRELGADLTPRQEKAILNALTVQQKERTQTVKEFLENLQQKQPPVPVPMPRTKKLPLLILAVLAAAAILVGVFFLFTGNDSVREDPAASIPAAEQETEASLQTETEADTTPATAGTPTDAPAETETSGKSTPNQPVSNKPSSGSSSSGSGSSGSASSGSGSVSGSMGGGSGSGFDSGMGTGSGSGSGSGSESGSGSGSGSESGSGSGSGSESGSGSGSVSGSIGGDIGSSSSGDGSSGGGLGGDISGGTGGGINGGDIGGGIGGDIGGGIGGDPGGGLGGFDGGFDSPAAEPNYQLP